MKRYLINFMILLLASQVSEARIVDGAVTCGRKKLSGVVVTDGKNFTQTGRNGKFCFEICDSAEFVYIVTPSGYAADWSSGVPAFYQQAEGKSKFTFDLKRLGQADDYSIIAIADPQTRGDKHFAKFIAAPLDDVCATVGKRSDRLADLTDILPTIADAVGVPVPQEWNIDGVSLFPEINGEQPLEKELTLVHFNPLWPTTAFPKASRYAMDDKYAYFWDGRIYEYKTDPEFRNPLMYADASDEIKKIVEPLKSRVEEVDFYPDMPGQPRRSPYSTFYDFAPPQNPF